jgi:hypothetical protein
MAGRSQTIEHIAFASEARASSIIRQTQSSTGAGRPMKGPLLGTSAAVDRDDAKVEKMINSICRGR